MLGVVLAVLTHRTHGLAGATNVLDGLVLGLAAPAVFFFVLALALPPLGLAAFAIAALAALISQSATVFAIPAGSQPDNVP